MVKKVPALTLPRNGHGADQATVVVPEAAVEGREPIWMDQFTTYRLLTVTKDISLLAASIYAERLDITIVESRIITLLAVKGPMSTFEVSDHSRMDRVKISRATQRLTSAKLLTRTQNKTDKRLIKLSLTASGRRTHQEIIGILQWFEQSVADAIGPEAVSVLRDSLGRLESYFLKISTATSAPPPPKRRSRTAFED